MFERHTFVTGENIDWTHGIFVTDPETGLIEGYRVHGAEPGHIYFTRPGGWIVSYDLDGSGLLVDSETGRAWRWPRGVNSLDLVTTSTEHLLFESFGDWPAFTRHFTIVSGEMEEVGSFSIDTEGSWFDVLFSPDGQTVAYSAADTVYLLPIESAQPVVLFRAQFDANRPDETRVSIRINHGPFDPSQIRVVAEYDGPTTTRSRDEYRYFTWEGATLPAPACAGPQSPDGRYVAQPGGGAQRWINLVVRDDGSVYREDRGYYPPVGTVENPWSSVVIAAADTCTPLFRVQSAYWVQTGAWPHNWVSTSDGFVIGVHDGYALLRIDPPPGLVTLPPSGPDGSPNPWPAAAPTGGSRYMAYGPSVYDIDEDRWSGPGEIPWSASWWGDTHRERWFSIREFRGGDASEWILLPPKIQLPPFGDEIALRVAATGGCLALREEPGTDNPTTECLPEGERLTLAEPNEPLGAPRPFHSSIGVAEGKLWVYVRTENGVEGWVSHDYLEHD